jgi:hypothetical protein
VRRLVPFLALSLALPACGGEERLTRADYVSRADAICKRYNDTIDKLGTPRTPKAIVEFTRKSLAAFDRVLVDERELAPPRELEALKERWLRQARIVRQDIVALRNAAERENVLEIDAALRKGVSDDRKANRLARQLGLEVCSQP